MINIGPYNESKDYALQSRGHSAFLERQSLVIQFFINCIDGLILIYHYINIISRPIYGAGLVSELMQNRPIPPLTTIIPIYQPPIIKS